VKFTAHTQNGLAHRLIGWSSLLPLSVLMSVRQCFIWLFYMQRRGISKKPSEQGGTHDLVDVPDRHCPHCRVRVGFLEEQAMTKRVTIPVSQDIDKIRDRLAAEPLPPSTWRQQLRYLAEWVLLGLVGVLWLTFLATCVYFYATL
jgi:hypothetical protein